MTTKPICPCETDVEDPGPTHIESCPFSDPDYDPPGGLTEIRAVMFAMLLDPDLDDALDAAIDTSDTEDQP